MPTRSAFWVAGLNSATLEIWIGISFSTMPPATPLTGFGLTCFLARLTPSTTTRSASRRVSTVPRLPLSLPVIMTTSSPLRIFSIISPLQHFRRERHDLHEALATQFTRNGPEDAGADRLELVVEENGSIAIKAHQGAIRTTNTLGGANHHGVVNVTLLDTTARSGVLNTDFDDVADAGIATLGAAQHLDTHH